MTPDSNPGFSIRQLDAVAVVGGLPDLVQVHEPMDLDADLVVTFLGFEDRLVAVPNILSAQSSPSRVVIGQYRTNIEANVARKPELLAAWEGKGSRCEFAPSGRVRHHVADVLRSMKAAARRPIRVAVDISVASNVAISALFPHLLRDPGVELTVLYAEANEYEPVDEEAASHAEAAALESGVSAVDLVPERAGYRIDALGETVVIVAGYGPDRARAVLGEIFPTTVRMDEAAIEWVIGVPPKRELAWRAVYSARMHSVVVDSPHCHMASTLNYKEIMGVLDSVFRRRCTTDHVTVVPIGSKMQCFGCVLFSFMRPEVRLLSAEPETYDYAHYSHGIGNVWSVALGSSTSLRSRLRTVDTLEVL
jgi:hypothetical protein